jgi:toxin ParE1/3/4
VASFRLSERAKAELVAIYDDSEARFGSYQADAYLAGLERSFGLLADFPGIGQAADHLKAGFRRFRFQAHIIFYTEDRDGVLIRAVVYRTRDIRPELFE